MRLLHAPDSVVILTFLNRIRADQAASRDAKSAYYNFDFDNDKPFPDHSDSDSAIKTDKPPPRFIWESLPKKYQESVLPRKKSELAQSSDSDLEKVEVDSCTTSLGEEEDKKVKRKGKKRCCAYGHENPDGGNDSKRFKKE